MALRKSKGDAMASGTGIPARVHRPHSRFDQGKLPSLRVKLGGRHARRRVGALDRHAAKGSGLPMLPPSIGISEPRSREISGVASGGSGEYWIFERYGKSAIGDQKDHAPGSGEHVFQKRDKTEAVTRQYMKMKNEISTQKRAPHARRPSTVAPGAGGSRPAREVTLPLVSRSSALRPRSRSGSCAVSAPRGFPA